MRLSNKRGEAVTLTVVALAIIAGLIGFFGRPVANKLLPGTLGTDQKIVSTKVVESKPVWMENPDGSSTMVQTTSTVMDSSNAPVKLTFMQKVQNLGGLGILLVVLGVIFPPFGAILAVIWRKVQAAGKKALSLAQTKISEVEAAKEGLSGDAKKIVLSIDEGLATMDANIKAAQTMAASTTDTSTKSAYNTIAAALVDMKSDFLAAMSKKQDSTTKLLVRELKND